MTTARTLQTESVEDIINYFVNNMFQVDEKVGLTEFSKIIKKLDEEISASPISIKLNATNAIITHSLNREMQKEVVNQLKLVKDSVEQKYLDEIVHMCKQKADYEKQIEEIKNEKSTTLKNNCMKFILNVNGWNNQILYLSTLVKRCDVKIKSLSCSKPRLESNDLLLCQENLKNILE